MAQLTTDNRDLENRWWLCEQVLEVRQQGGMSLERALAMLHKLTDLDSHEPYVSDYSPVPAVTWDYGEPLVDGHTEDLREAWARDRFDDGSGPLPDRFCAICKRPLERRYRESFAAYEVRETCSKAHAAALREQRRRRTREEVVRGQGV